VFFFSILNFPSFSSMVLGISYVYRFTITV
jgi:hypothetical protein